MSNSTATIADKTLAVHTAGLVPVDKIDPSPVQPRTAFADLGSLAASISAHGLLHAVTVRKVGKRYELIAGERRLRACRQIPITAIPAVVLKVTDAEAHELTAMENLEREDLTPIEESRSIQVLPLRARPDSGRV